MAKRSQGRSEGMSRTNWLVIAALIIIGLAVYGAGLALHASADQASVRIPTVALLPSATATLPPTNTLPPTVTPSPVPSAIPSATTAPSATPSETPGPPSPTFVRMSADLPTQPPVTLPTATPLPPSFTPSLTFTPSSTPTPGPASPTSTPGTPGTLGTATAKLIQAKVQSDAGVKLRSAPNTSSQTVSVLLQGVVMDVISRTTDNQWLHIRYRDQQGWVAAQYVQLLGPLDAIKTEDEVQAAGVPSGRQCVSSVGDSVAYGEVLFEMPGVGFIKVKMNPFASFVTDQLAKRKIKGFDVYDRSYPGVGISSPKHTSFITTPIFNELLKDKCKYTMVLPWVNDLSSGLDPAFSATDHMGKLADFARRLATNNPKGRIFIMNYYSGAPAAFSKNMAYGFTPLAIQLFNDQMALSCTSGELSKIPQVTCINSPNAFSGLGTSYVVGPMQRAEIEAVMTRPLTADEVKMFDYYTRTNPGSPLTGDGIHLSSIGKSALAAYVIDIALKLSDLP